MFILADTAASPPVVFDVKEMFALASKDADRNLVIEVRYTWPALLTDLSQLHDNACGAHNRRQRLVWAGREISPLQNKCTMLQGNDNAATEFVGIATDPDSFWLNIQVRGRERSKAGSYLVQVWKVQAKPSLLAVTVS